MYSLDIVPSHNHALRAAAGVGIVVAHFHLVGRAAIVRSPAAGRVTLHLTVVPPDFPDDIVECLVNIDPRLRRGFNELAAKRFRKRLTLCYPM